MAFCLLNKHSSLFLDSNDPEYGCKQFLRNVGNYLPVDPASYPIKTYNFICPCIANLIPNYNQ